MDLRDTKGQKIGDKPRKIERDRGSETATTSSKVMGTTNAAAAAAAYKRGKRRNKMEGEGGTNEQQSYTHAH